MWLFSSGSDNRKTLLPPRQRPAHPAPPSQTVPLSQVDRIRRNDSFLCEQLGVDTETRALASQNLQAELNALLDGDPPVLQVSNKASGTQYSVTLRNEQDLAHLQRLGRFLLEHKQRAALFLFAAAALRLQENLQHPAMHGLMCACGQAMRQASTTIDPYLLESLQGLAIACAQKEVLSQPELALFLSDTSPAAPLHQPLDALMRQLSATDTQCRQAQERDDLRQAADELLSTQPALVLHQDENGHTLCQIPACDTRDERFQRLVWFVHQLHGLRVPCAYQLFAALSQATRGHGGLEADLLKCCGKALLDAPAGLARDLLPSLCARVCELVVSDGLDPDWLAIFESAAKHHRADGALLRLRLTGIDLDIQRLRTLENADRRRTLTTRLMGDIQHLHHLALKTGGDGSDTLVLMRLLYEASLDGPDADTVKQALEALIWTDPEQLVLQRRIDGARAELASWLPAFDPGTVDDAVQRYRSRKDAAEPELARQRHAQLKQYLDDLADCLTACPPWPELEALARFVAGAFPDLAAPGLLPGLCLRHGAAHPEDARQALERFWSLVAAMDPSTLALPDKDIDGVLRACQHLNEAQVADQLTLLRKHMSIPQVEALNKRMADVWLEWLEGANRPEAPARLRDLLENTPPLLWTPFQRQRLIERILHLPRQHRTVLLTLYSKEILQPDYCTPLQRKSLAALISGINKLSTGEETAMDVLTRVRRTVINFGTAKVPEWFPLAKGLLIALLEQDHSQRMLGSHQLRCFIVDWTILPGEPVATLDACIELASTLQDTLRRLVPPGQTSALDGSTAPALIATFGNSLADYDPHRPPVPNNVAWLHVLFLLDAAWNALSPTQNAYQQRQRLFGVIKPPYDALMALRLALRDHQVDLAMRHWKVLEQWLPDPVDVSTTTGKVRNIRHARASLPLLAINGPQMDELAEALRVRLPAPAPQEAVDESATPAAMQPYFVG